MQDTRRLMSKVRTACLGGALADVFLYAAVTAYRAHASSFYKYPLEQVCVCCLLFSLTHASPAARLRSRSERAMRRGRNPCCASRIRELPCEAHRAHLRGYRRSSLQHVSPCAVVAFGCMRETGTLGMRYAARGDGTAFVVDDLAIAERRVCMVAGMHLRSCLSHICGCSWCSLQIRSYTRVKSTT